MSIYYNQYTLTNHIKIFLDKFLKKFWIFMPFALILKKLFRFKVAAGRIQSFKFSCIVFVLDNFVAFLLILHLCISPKYYQSKMASVSSPQKNRFNEQKQSLRKCVLNCGTFLCRLVQNNNVKWPNSRFYGEREHTTVNFSFSFLTRTPILSVWFLGSLPYFL